MQFKKKKKRGFRSQRAEKSEKFSREIIKAAIAIYKQSMHMSAAWHRIFLGDPVVAFNFH